MHKHKIVPILAAIFLFAAAIYAFAGSSETSIEEQLNYKVQINRGWNIVSIELFGVGQSSPGKTDCDLNQLALYSYFPIEKAYGTYFLKKLDSGKYMIAGKTDSDKELLEKYRSSKYMISTTANGWWIYSKKDCMIQGMMSESLADPGVIEQLPKLAKGWNFLSTTPDMVSLTIDNFKGSCNLSSAYIYKKGWEKADRRIFTSNDLGLGIILYAEKECFLGPKPPAPPENEENQTHSVEIDSMPQSADVLIDTQHRGKTPLKTDITLGEHKLLIMKEGYEDYETSLRKEQKELNASLTRIEEIENFYGQQVSVLKLFGQKKISETARNKVTANSIDHAPGVLVDRRNNPNTVYVADTGNNRFLGFNGIGYCSNTPKPCTTDLDCSTGKCNVDGKKSADIVFGQDDFQRSACNRDNNIGIYQQPTATTLCLIGFPYTTNLGEHGLRLNFDVDNENNLYIPDYWNNRILKYNQPFSQDKSNGKGDNIADFVIGQPDFESNGINKGNSALYDPSVNVSQPTDESLWISAGPPDHVSSRGVSLDAENNVWVADTFNERVLRYKKGSKRADLVIGQDNFETRDNSCQFGDPRTAPTDKLCSPTLARINPETGELYVLDEHPGGFKARILIYKPPFSNGTLPYKVIVPELPNFKDDYTGQPVDFKTTGFIFNTFKQEEYSNGVLWLSDSVLRVDLINDKGEIIKVINSPNKDQEGGEHNYPPECGPNAFEGFNLIWPGGQIGIDSANNMYLADERTGRISRYAIPYETRPIAGKTCLPQPNGGLFPGTEPNILDDSTFNSGVGLAVSGNQLIIRDGQGLKVWNNYMKKTIGSTPDFTLYRKEGKSGFADRVMISDAIDDSNRLWINNEHGGIKVFQLPLKGNDEPLADFIELYWSDNGQKVQKGRGNMAFDNFSKALYFIDAENSRILRVKNYNNFRGKLYADMVIGQPDKETIGCNHNQQEGWTVSGQPLPDSLCAPYQIKFDKLGNLYVLDNNYECHGNDRITVFMADDIKKASGLFPNLEAKKAFIGGLNSKGPCAYETVNMPGSPVSMAFNSKNELVIGNDGYYGDAKTRHKKQLWLYKNPLEKQTPDAYIDLPLGAAGEIAYDSQDNLIIQDHTWSKVWIINPDKDKFWLKPANK